MKIATIVGARPQFVKAATVSRVIANRDGVEEILIHTGQHFDANMSDVFFDEMSIPKPDVNLEINSLSHGAMTGRMLEGIEKVFQDHQPDWVLVYGDTNSTLAGALAAKKLHIRVAHVEAGLRSFNMKMPEEINRILTDRISDVLFCPTELAVSHLNREGFENLDCQVMQVGDVMKDAANFYASRSRKPENLDLPETFALCTVHRAENTDLPERLKAIFDGLSKIHQQLPVVLPLHPRTKSRLETFDMHPNVIFIEPVGYLQMIHLLQHCSVVLTDSGGLQKEAYFFDKPCVTLRDETEWMELVEHGVNRLSPIDADAIFRNFEAAKASEIPSDLNLYGSADAADKIVDALVKLSH